MANLMGQMKKALQEKPQGALPSNTIPNPQEEIKAITTQSGIILAEPSVPLPPFSSSSKEVERDPETITYQLPSPVSSPSEPPKRNPHQPPILYPLRLNKEKLQDKSDIQKLPGKLEDPGKFLIPYDFPELKKCMELADFGDNINLMPLSVWKKLMLPKLVPTRMTLELANRSISYPASIADDVFVQVGKFTFPPDFVVVDYDVNSHVPLIVGRPFLRTAHALVDVYGEELIMRDGDENSIFHAESSTRHPHKHGNDSINMINFIDITCEDHFDEVLKIQKSIHCLSGSPTPSDLVVDSLVEETDILLFHFNDSLPDYETFCFDIEEKSSGSTTSHSHHSLLEYESFCFDVDHIKEESSGNTTSHSDLSLLEYESFHFDLSIDQLPLVDRSDSQHDEFTDELAHIISPQEYDHFYFDLELDPGEMTRVLKKNISDTLIKDLKIHELNDFPCDSIFSKEFSEIDLLVSFPSRNKDKVFEPEIFTINRVHSQRFHILPLDDFSTISFVNDSLLLTDPSEIETFLSFTFENEDKVFDLGILIIDGVFSFTRKSPRLLIDNFMIDNCHILSEIFLNIVSSISFHPKDKEIRG
ncbi:reverse transcriptase domain-containing protein [Tanacetum coccineum]